MPGRKKGTEKTGGRKKGTSNKVSKDAKDWVKKFVCGNASTIEKAWKDLPDDSPLKFQFFAQMMRHIVPPATNEEEGENKGSSIDKTIDDLNNLEN